MRTQNGEWPWFAIMAKTTREKCAKDALEALGYTCFLPLYEFRRRWSDRMKKCEGPLFPGYLFCRLDPLDRLPILTAPGVIQIVGIGKRPVSIHEAEINSIQRAVQSGLSTSPWPYARANDVVRIERGPLQGLSGTVIKVKSEWKMVLSVELLQRSIAVEIDSDWISAPIPGVCNSTGYSPKQLMGGALASIDRLRRNANALP